MDDARCQPAIAYDLGTPGYLACEHAAMEHPQQTPSSTDGQGQGQVFWIDPRGFKETDLKDELEAQMHVPVKCYRTADMCMRLLRKRQGAPSKTNAFRIFLVSWSNAPALVSFLNEENHLHSKVVILCDTCGSKGSGRASAFVEQHPSVELAYTWPQAVSIASRLVANAWVQQ